MKIVSLRDCRDHPSKMFRCDDVILVTRDSAPPGFYLAWDTPDVPVKVRREVFLRLSGQIGAQRAEGASEDEVLDDVGVSDDGGGQRSLRRSSAAVATYLRVSPRAVRGGIHTTKSASLDSCGTALVTEANASKKTKHGDVSWRQASQRGPWHACRAVTASRLVDGSPMAGYPAAMTATPTRPPSTSMTVPLTNCESSEAR